ncbi:MAG TPA: helix-turn-helix domain-containing protein [Streptomyces sp.]
MLRIHFTGRDLESVRIAQRPDPLWEIVCSLCRLQDREGPVVFGPWRRRTSERIARGEVSGDAVRMLCGLVPAYSAYFPDFLTPPVDVDPCGVRTGIDRVLSTPQSRLRKELTLLTSSNRPPAEAGLLARGDLPALKRLGGRLLTYDQTVLAPVWHRVEAAVRADVAWRSRALATGGVRKLMATFRPLAAWRSPVMEVDYPVDRDLRLAGRGLLLVPSYFCWRQPISLVDPNLPPVLVYPIDKSLASDQDTAPDRLVRLLGQTRAALLYETAARGCATTSALAGAVEVSLPSASQQLAILREAGLVAGRREGKYLLHTVTPLGLRLLGPGTPGSTSTR